MIKVGQIWKCKENNYRIAILVDYGDGFVECISRSFCVLIMGSEYILNNYDLVDEFDFDTLVKKLYGDD